MKKSYFLLICLFYQINILLAKDYIIIKSIEAKAIPCHIINFSSEIVSFSTNSGDSLLFIKKEFVHKIKFSPILDSIIIAKNCFKKIECEIVEIDEDFVRYKTENSEEEQKISTDDVIYVNFINCDNKRLIDYNNIAENIAQQRYFTDYVVLLTQNGSSQKVKFTYYDSKGFQVTIQLKDNNEKSMIVDRNNIREIIFSELTPITLNINSGNKKMLSTISKGHIKGEIIEFNNDNFKISDEKSSFANSTNTQSFNKTEIVAINSRNVQKAFDRELKPTIRRFTVNFGMSYNKNQIPDDPNNSFSDEVVSHLDKLKKGITANTTLSFYRKTGHGIGLKYNLFYSSAETDSIVYNYYQTIESKANIKEKFYSNFLGLSYNYISSTSFIENKNIINFSIIPGLFLDYHPLQVNSINDGNVSYKIKNNTFGVNANLGYDIIFNSFVGLGFELSYFISRTTEIKIDGVPKALGDDLSHWNNRIELTIGLRFY